jgi:tetratricopeptide (TPR) repeat protein
MSSAAVVAGPIVNTILVLAYLLIAALLALLALMIVGLFPFSARLAPVYRALGLRDLEWIAIMRRSIRESEWADVPVLEERFRRCAGIAVGTRRRRLRSIALYALGYTLILQARWDEAAAALEESLAIARERGRRSDLANALRGTALLRAMRGDFDAARPFLDEAAALLPRLQPRTAAAVWLDVGWMASQGNRFDEAWRAWSMTVQLAADPRTRHLARIARLNLAWTDLRTGQRDRGRSSIAQLLAEAADQRDLTVEARALVTLAAADWEQGDDATARARAQQGLDILRRRSIVLHAGEAHSVLGLVEMRAGNTALAEEHLASAAPLVVTRNGRENVAELLTQMGDAAAREGRIGDARARFERAVVILDRWGTPEHAAAVRAALAALPPG